jgi:tetratricopeptide (TPR) repeat protein
MHQSNRIQWLLLFCLSASNMPALGEDNEQATKLYAQGDYQAVVQLLTPDGEQPVDASIQDQMLLARSYRYLAQLPEAVAVLRGVLEVDGDHAEANRLAGQALYELNRHKEAVDYLESALRLKREAHIAGLLGLTWFALDDLTKAKSYLEQALAEDVSDPTISRCLGQIYLSSGQGNRAEKYLLLARDAGDDSAELHRLLARAYMLQHKTLGPVLVRRLTNKPAPGQIVDGLLVLRPIDGQPERYQACTPFSAMYEGYWLLEKNKDDAEAIFVVASGWMSAGMHDLAGQFIDRLTKAEGESQRVRRLRADLALATHDWPALRKALTGGDDSTSLKPIQIVDYRYRAAMHLRSAGEYEPAVEFLKQADALDPTSAKVLRALISLSRTTADHDAAIGYTRRLIDLFPDSRDIDELRNALKQLKAQAGSGDQ